MGAAIQGAALAGRPAPAILIDITAHSYGIGTLMSGPMMFAPRMMCSHIIRRGTPLPVKKSEVFFTVEDSQTLVKIPVYQGESIDPEENLKIGEFSVNGLSDVPSGSPIIVQLEIDLSGILHVTATEKATGLAKSVTIDTAGHHRLNLDAARTNLAALFEEEDALGLPDEADDAGDDTGDDVGDDADAGADAPAGPSRPELLASAKSLRRRAEAVLAGQISPSDAAEIRALLDASSGAITRRDWAALQEADDKLSDVLFYLED
jgi:molecular chaperone DnaK